MTYNRSQFPAMVKVFNLFSGLHQQILFFTITKKVLMKLAGNPFAEDAFCQGCQLKSPSEVGPLECCGDHGDGWGSKVKRAKVACPWC